jgi:hypothetical protein
MAYYVGAVVAFLLAFLKEIFKFDLGPFTTLSLIAFGLLMMALAMLPLTPRRYSRRNG